MRKGARSCFLCPFSPPAGPLLQMGAQFPCLGSKSSQLAGATWLSICLYAYACACVYKRRGRRGL